MVVNCNPSERERHNYIHQKEPPLEKSSPNLNTRALDFVNWPILVYGILIGINCYILTVIRAPPNKNIIIKSELFPRNDPSSNIRQYRYVNVILNRKLKPIVPKNKNVVASLHS